MILKKSSSSNCRYEDDIACKIKLEGFRIRSKCDWYEKREKSTKFFSTWEKDILFKTE